MHALSQFIGLKSLESIIDCSPLMVVPETLLSDAIALMTTQSKDLIHPNYREKFASKHFWAIANLVSFKIKYRIFLKERWSEYKWLLTRAIVHKDPTGKPARLIGVSVDITSCVEAKEEQLALKKSKECFCIFAESISQQVWNAQQNHSTISYISKQRECKLAQKALKHSEERFRNLVEVSSDWLWEVDKNRVYIYISPKIRDILGYEPTEVLGKTPFEFMSSEEAERVIKIFTAIAAAQQPFKSFESINIHQNGSLVVLETNKVPVFDVEGQFRGYRSIA